MTDPVRRHALSTGDRGVDIDPPVIGPPGVVTVNTKHHPTAAAWVGGSTSVVNGQCADNNSQLPYSRACRSARRCRQGVDGLLRGVAHGVTDDRDVRAAPPGHTVGA